MKGSAKFGVTDVLACIGYGFAASFVVSAGLLVTVPQLLAGGHTEGAGGLDNLIGGLMLAFFGGGILFSLAAAWLRAVIRKRTDSNDSDGWWPTPPL